MTELSDLPLRDSLRGKVPYGAPQINVPIALNVNENTHPIDEDVVADISQAIASVVKGLNRYPDRDFLELRRLLANYLGAGLEAENIWAANGSNETLQQVLQAFGGPGRTFMSFTPSYSMYELLAQGTDTKWLEVPRPANYNLTPEFVSDNLQEIQPDIAIICGPNNPTGTSLDIETIEAAYEAFAGILIIDEAYFEFETGKRSATSLLAGRPRLIVSRTMSKAFSFAGVRLGYLAADPAIIDALKLVRLPYHLSALTQAAACAAIRHSGKMLEAVGDIRAQRNYLEEEFAKLGLHVHQSGANFLLVDGFGNNQEAFEFLLKHGVLVRKFNIPGHLRITVGTAAENLILLRCIKKYLGTED